MPHFFRKAIIEVTRETGRLSDINNQTKSTMTKTQIVWATVGVVAGALLLAFVYQQFSGSQETNSDDERYINSAPRKNDAEMTQKEEVIAVPETINSISADIEGETALDTSAMEREESGESSQIEADSQSVNNLGTSYDENNL